MERRALVIFSGALGDLICLGPAIRALGRRDPAAALELMTRAELARFAVSRMGIARGHSIDRRELSHLFVDGGGVRSTDGWAGGDGRLAQGGYAAARKFFGAFAHIYSFFSTDNSAFRHALEAVAGGAVDFYQFRPPGGGHAAQCYLRAIGERMTEPLESAIELLPEDLTAAARVLATAGLGENAFVLILPGSGSAGKNWPAENFVALVRKLEMPALVILGPAEAALEPWFAAHGLATLSGLELGVVAALARSARVVAANDSGVAHLAAAAGARVVALFGPTDPARWRPLGKVEVIRHQPLQYLPVDTVAAALIRLTA